MTEQESKYHDLKFLSKSIHYVVTDIRALFNYNDIDMVEPNKARLNADIECAMSDLKKLHEMLNK